VREVLETAAAKGVRVGSINTNTFQDQEYKLGSFGSPDETARQRALKHCLESIRLGQEVDSGVVTLWFADGTNYPGQDDIRTRKHRFETALKQCHDALGEGQTMLLEYKPFEPAFYQTDIADWGMSYLHCRKAGPKAKVLVDTGHHYPSQNIEQIVAWLLDEQMLGGFHFNDRRYADDDLTLGSIDPYQVFRIFHEIHAYAADTGTYPAIAYMVDQSHNLKPKTEAMIQTATTAQELWLKAARVDRARLREAQQNGRILDAEETLKTAFRQDVTPLLADWRRARNLPEDPLAAFRESGYLAHIEKDRRERREALGIAGGGGGYA
jgi:L-rhamnose isomerase/sugar isomerase